MEAESRATEAAAGMTELRAQRQTEEEDAAVIVEHAQAEIKSLRDQLALREDELARLREDTPSSPSLSSVSSSKAPTQPKSENVERDLSTAQSHIDTPEYPDVDLDFYLHDSEDDVIDLWTPLLLVFSSHSSPLDAHCHYSHLMLRAGLLSPHSRLLPHPMYENSVALSSFVHVGSIVIGVAQ